MRIAFATKEHLPATGGVQLTSHHLAGALTARGHEVTVLALEAAHQPAPPERDSTDGARAALNASPPPPRAAYSTLRSAAPAAPLRRMVREGCLDAVVVHACDAALERWASSMLDAAHGLPALLYLHDRDAVELAAARGGAEPVAAVSRFLAREAELLGVAAAVLPPVVDERDYTVHTTREVALFVNPVPAKGLDTAIALAEAHPEIAFAWTLGWPLGDGAVEFLWWQARRLGNVELRPRSATPAELYGDARLLLAPSACPEAYGRVAREAVTSGIPVIGADVGGLGEAVGDGGVLIDPAEPAAAWSHELGRLWHDPLEYGRAVDGARREAASRATSRESVATALERLLAA